MSHPSPTLLRLALVTLLLAVSAPPAAARGVPQGETLPVPRSWLGLDSIEQRGRRPFRPDAVWRTLFVEGRWPSAGETLSGETGKATWEALTVENGAVPGSRSYAITTLAVEEDTVVLARVLGASTLIVDGVPYATDLYRFGHGGVPVALSAGSRRLAVTGIRGGFDIELRRPAAPLVFATWDSIVPDVLRGEDQPTLPLGLGLLNASAREQMLELRYRGEHFEAGTVRLALLPCEHTQVPLLLVPRVHAGEGLEGEALELTVSAHLDGSAQPVAETTLRLPLRDPGDLHRRTFVSGMDGSVQEYVLRPPAGERAENAPMRLLLSLHGASVQAWNQASSYAARPDFWVAAATNRRPYGFDWQDWGRRDAYEVLERALAVSGVDRRLVYLGGHSMGGHGTWHLAANDPDGFAAIAPSAGWRSFDTYGRRPEGALRDLWHAADAASNTEARLDNLAQLPTYILHSYQDESVPVEEAFAMERLLREAGGDVRLHIEEGKGHWWDSGRGPGADCLSWEPFFALFRRHEIAQWPTTLAFETVDPGVDARHHWVEVLQLERYGVPARVEATWDRDENRVTLELDNVRQLRLWGEPARAGLRVEGNDGWTLEPGPRRDFATLRREGISWVAVGGERDARVAGKRPASSGPLKRAFDREFSLVTPTGGSAEENRLAFERARYDAGVWRYRGNGRAPLVRDVDFLARPGSDDRSVILYGNRDTNRAWPALLEGSPVDVGRGYVQVGAVRHPGAELGALFVRPRPGGGDGLVGALGTSGPAAEAVTPTLGLFISGVGYPDWCVFGLDVLSAGDGGVREAGWFDADWKIQR